MRKWLTPRYLANFTFYAVILLLIFNPSAKALMIRGLMVIGFFQPDVPAAVKRTAAVPDITFMDTKGKRIALSSLKGKVVFINFWATWCPPCIAELPSVNKLHKQLRADTNIVFLVTDADNNFSRSAPFLLRHHYNLPLYQTISAVPEMIMGNTIPTTVVINKAGILVFRHEGAADYTNKEFGAYLVKLSAE